MRLHAIVCNSRLQSEVRSARETTVEDDASFYLEIDRDTFRRYGQQTLSADFKVLADELNGLMLKKILKRMHPPPDGITISGRGIGITNTTPLAACFLPVYI